MRVHRCAAEHELDVGDRKLGARLDEGMKSARHHGGGTDAEQIGREHARRHAVEPHLPVERSRAAACERQEHRDMVLQIAADRQIDDRRDADLAQMRRRADAGQHQDLRRAEGAGGNDDFAFGGCAVAVARS